VPLTRGVGVGRAGPGYGGAMDRSALAQLPPKDAAVALRSLLRRTAESFRPAEVAGEPEAADMTLGIGGPSPLGLVLGAARALEALLDATHKALVLDHPRLDPAVFDRERRDATDRVEGDLGTALLRLRAAASTLADEVSRQSATSWGRTAQVGDEAVTALDLVREAVATFRTYLDRLEPAVAAARTHS
jgi:hypothetical protein